MIILNTPPALNLFSETVVKTPAEMDGLTQFSFPGIDALVAAGFIVTPLYATIYNSSDSAATAMRIGKDSENANANSFDVPGGGSGNCFYQQEGGFSYMVCNDPANNIYFTLTIDPGASGFVKVIIFYSKTLPSA